MNRSSPVVQDLKVLRFTLGNGHCEQGIPKAIAAIHDENQWLALHTMTPRDSLRDACPTAWNVFQTLTNPAFSGKQ